MLAGTRMRSKTRGEQFLYLDEPSVQQRLLDFSDGNTIPFFLSKFGSKRLGSFACRSNQDPLPVVLRPMLHFSIMNENE